MGTVRQAVLASGIAEGMSITKAGQLAGYHSVQNASDAYRGIRSKMIEDLAAIGVSTQAIAQKIKDKMSATETRLVSGDVTTPDGVRKQFTDAIDLEDHGTQLHATELAADILGLRGSKDSGTSIGTVNILWAGQSPAWANPASDESVTDAIPVQHSTQSVHSTIGESDTTPISTLEGTGLDPGLSTRTHSGSSSGDKNVLTQSNSGRSSSANVLTQRVVKKRQPRLPGWRKK
jgi:hypothetical protein